SKGRLFIISGPSGSGKDTILAQLFKLYPDIKFSISSITRPMRKGEKPGEKYNFISREEFEKMISNDELLEYNSFIENYYGTPKAPVLEAINGGNDIIIEVDVNGAAQIREKMPDCISIFIMPPDLLTLKERLCARGTDSPEKIKERLECAKNEIKRADEFDFVVVNDNVDTAVKKFAAIIKEAKK
ncbi:MAG: guanylate kinase, partial [Clostridia bacterium]|nr:guanylate kinase [Clostridia bacterium]